MDINCLPPALFLLLFIFSTNKVVAQEYYASSEAVAPIDRVSKVYRMQKRLSAVYDGYAIEVASSELPVEKSHPIFRNFGKIYYQRLNGGGYSYLIKAEFKDLKSVKHFAEAVVKPKMPYARIFKYKKGKRKLRG